MNRRNRRSFLGLTGGAIGAALLAACGSGDDAATSKPAAPAATGAAGAAGTAARPARSIELLNVSYDPTRELYEQYAKLFAAAYKAKSNVTAKISNSHGGSGSQARAIADGLQADVATLALAGDTAVLEKAGLIKPGWESKFPNNSNPYVSTIVLLVRKGNPKGIKDWGDLARSGVGVITPNPKTSGGARWNFLAAWGSVTLNGGSEDAARQLVGSLYKNTLVLDSGARASTQTFVEKQIGDVLIAWENEALLSVRDSKDFEIIYPKQSILAEPAVAVVDAVVDKKGTREDATEFLNFLYSDDAQDLIARNFYRPSNQTVLAKYKAQFPTFDKLFTIRDFTGWPAVQTKFFDTGAIFDQIYKPS